MSSKQETVECLIQVLQTGNDANRCFSAQALGRIGDQQAINPLIEALNDEDEDVVMDIVTALGDLKAFDAIPLLIECYNHHPVGDVKVLAVEAIGKIAGNDESERDSVIKFLMGVVEGHGEDTQWEFDDDEWDDWWDAQIKAIDALGNWGASEAVPVILEALDDEDAQELNAVAFQALAKMGEEGEKALIQRLSSDDIAERRYAAKHLNIVQSDDSRDALIQALNDTDEAVCVAAAKSLTQYQGEVSDSALLNSLQDPREEIRQRILEVMMSSDFEIPNEDLKKILKDPGVSVRKQTLRLIAKKKNIDLSTNVFSCLRDQELSVVTEVIATLGELGVQEAGNVVAKLLSEPGLSTDLRVQSAIALGKIGAETELPVLVEMIKDEEQSVRLNSLNTVAHLDLPGTQEILLAALRGELLTDPNQELNEQDGEQVISEEANQETKEVEEETETAEKTASEETESSEKTTSENIEEEEIPEPKSTLEAIMAPDQATLQDDPENDKVELTDEEQHFLQIAEENKLLNEKLQKRVVLAPHQDIKRIAASILGEASGAEVVSGLIDALQDSEETVQQAAAESLGRIGDPAAVEALSVMLTSELQIVRLKVANSLGKLESAESAMALMECFSEEKDLYVRIQVLQALAEQKQVLAAVEQWSQFKNVVISLLQDEESGVRKAAAELLLAVDVSDPNNDGKSLIPEIGMIAYMDGGEQRMEIGRLFQGEFADAGSALFLKILADSSLENQHRVAIEALQEIHRV